MLKEYSSMDGIDLAKLVKRKEITPLELTNLAFEGISQINPKINAIAKTLPNEAKRGISTELSGPFEGVPFLIKDYPAHGTGIPVKMGSRLIEEGIEMSQDSSLMTRFRNAGLITIGSTTTPEFALDGSTESLLYGPTRNPWDLERTTGGSSGGAAAAVASGIVPIAHGTDSGGSIRCPASFCGLVGLKPTRGRVPSGPNSGEPFFGLNAEFALTKSVRDAAALLDAVAGPDIGCYAWAEPPKTPYFESIQNGTESLTIAYMSKPLNNEPVDPEILDALHKTIKLCEELGHKVVEAYPKVDEEMHQRASARFLTASLYRDINKVAKSLNRKPSEEILEPVVWSAYEYGRSLTAEDLLEAIDIQNDISRKTGYFISQYDALLTPATAQLPVKIGEVHTAKPGWDIEKWFAHMNSLIAFEDLFNTTGLPALSLPLNWSKDGLPIGMQFVGRFADETTLLKLAAQLEHAMPWKEKYPPIHISKI